MMGSFTALVEYNPVVAMVGAGAVAYGISQLRALPKRLFDLLLDQFTVSVRVFDDDQGFAFLNLWLGRQRAAARVRRTFVAHLWDSDSSQSVFALTPGDGVHLIRTDLGRVIVHRTVADQPVGGNRSRPQSLTIRAFGRDQAVIRAIFEAAQRVVESGGRIAIYTWSTGGYRLIERREKRAMATIDLPRAVKDDLIADVERFLGRRDWYRERGLPYRRGYLLAGAPGTGKSSFIFSLASLLERPVYIVNLAQVSDDAALQVALSTAGRGIVVIEDIDAAGITAERAPSRAPDRGPAGPIGSAPSPVEAFAFCGVTLSGLLNAIDGIAGGDGRILFMTTNYAEKLDRALVRPGRADRHVIFPLADAATAETMFRRFHPGRDPAAFMAALEPCLPASPAEIQGYLLGGEPPRCSIARAAP